MCTEYEDVLSTDLSDKGETQLVTKDINTGNSQPISQKSYSLPLKDPAWVQNVLELLGIFFKVRGVSTWTSPIVVMPKSHSQMNLLEKDFC